MKQLNLVINISNNLGITNIAIKPKDTYFLPGKVFIILRGIYGLIMRLYDF